MNKKNALPENSPISTAPGAELLWSWSQELQSACSAATDEAWDAVGRAVVMLGADPRRGIRVAQIVAEAAKMNFIGISEEDVANLPNPGVFAGAAPALVWLEPGEWCANPNEDDTPETRQHKSDIQERVTAWIHCFDATCPLVLLTAPLPEGSVSDALAVPGLFDRTLDLPELSLAQLGEEFIEELGLDICSDVLRGTPAKLGKLVQMRFNELRDRDMAVLYLKRLAHREGRKLDFTDLMHLYVRGTIDSGMRAQPTEKERRTTAVHEAGHAVAAIVDSGGQNIPDFCTIIPAGHFLGVVVSSIGFAASNDQDMTYSLFRHRVRVNLAGRAAEELVYGIDGVTMGASSDLENATRASGNAFALCGFAPNMTTHDQSASNLAVIIGEPSASECAHVEALVRQFLDQEYRHVYKLLEANRSLLDGITERLMWDPIVDQSELEAVCKELRVI